MISRSRHLHRWLAALVLLALVAAACGGDDGGSDESTTSDAPPATDDGPAPTDAPPASDPVSTDAPTTDAALTASWKGVTEDTISIAVSLLDFEPLIELNLQDFGWGDQRLIWEFYLDQLNERGGVAGRQVDAVLDFYNPAFAVEAEAACLRMTEDREVFAVLGAFFGPAETATPCLTDQEDLVVFGGQMTVELLESARAVWVAVGTADRRKIPGFFDLLEENGYVDGQRVAVVTGRENEDDTNNVVLPILEELGLEVVVTAVNTISTDDVAAEDRFWDTTAERIRAEDAEVILINGDTTGAIRGIGRNSLDQQMWVLTNTQLTNLGSTVDRADADGALAYASATSDEVWNEPQLAACVKEFTDAHPEIEVLGPLEVEEGGERWDTAVTLACRWIALFELVMNEAGPELTPESVQAAYERLGDVELPGFFNASFGPGKPDANDDVRLSAWDHTAGENGSMVPVTDLADATP